jgi:hypothetical protein
MNKDCRNLLGGIACMSVSLFAAWRKTRRVFSFLVGFRIKIGEIYSDFCSKYQLQKIHASISGVIAPKNPN